MSRSEVPSIWSGDGVKWFVVKSVCCAPSSSLLPTISPASPFNHHLSGPLPSPAIPCPCLCHPNQVTGLIWLGFIAVSFLSLKVLQCRSAETYVKVNMEYTQTIKPLSQLPANLLPRDGIPIKHTPLYRVRMQGFDLPSYVGMLCQPILYLECFFLPSSLRSQHPGLTIDRHCQVKCLQIPFWKPECKNMKYVQWHVNLWGWIDRLMCRPSKTNQTLQLDWNARAYKYARITTLENPPHQSLDSDS